mmetsp:Transcript_43159/g.67309  ORF Transcript_43159/g.67309 Transcript_43159/m.67309 type:complete len:261 (+) Transcript_43159:148-930(+)
MFGPREIRQVTFRCLDWCVATENIIVPAIHRYCVLVSILENVRKGPICQRIESALGIFPSGELNALGRLIHAAPCYENIFLALCQRALKGLHLAHKVKVCMIHRFTIAIHLIELFKSSHTLRHFPQCCFPIFVLNKLCASQGLWEQMQCIDCHQVHTFQYLWKVLMHQIYKHVVGCQPRCRENSLSSILGQVLRNVCLKRVHLGLNRKARTLVNEKQVCFGLWRANAPKPCDGSCREHRYKNIETALSKSYRAQTFGPQT